MKKLFFVLFLVWIQVLGVFAQRTLDSLFYHPSLESRPIVWWRWMGTQVSKEGITADLEALKDVGLGGVIHFQISSGINDKALMEHEKTILPKVKTLSNEWWKLMEHAIAESKRLGLSFRMQNCLGYSTNGGPWITPELAMQKLVWSDTIITIDKKTIVNFPLNHSEVHKSSNYYNDIAVVAVKLNPSNVIPLSDILDISDYVNKGYLSAWQADAGQWKIIRYGYTPTGVMPHPVDYYVNGLECDKMSREAITEHFTHYVKKFMDISGDEAGKTLEAVTLDSYEAGGQTWTHRFREKFIEKRGYDPLCWLPTFAQGEIRGSRNSALDWIPPMGELIVESKDLTERFRYDYYQTIEDLVLEENIAALADLTHRFPGVKFELQPYNAPYNFIRGGRLADKVSGEFWHGNHVYGWWTLNLAASVAHITQNPIVFAEAFTASPSKGDWSILPEDMKAEADSAFSLGINFFQLHVMPHQPWPDTIFPGMISQSWGTQLNRHNSWWKQSKAWNEYLTCVQEILRQGEAVVDIAYLYPRFRKGLLDVEGYKCDAMDESFVIDNMEADDKGLVLKNGRRYRILVLSHTDEMSVELMRKIASLVKNGGYVIGPRPLKSPSLSGYPKNDKEVSDLADKVWGDCDGVHVKKHSYGKGYVYWGMSVTEVLEEMQSEKDVEVLGGSKAIVWTHRKTADTDIYFIANQQRDPVDAKICFRIEGKIPELWDPEKKEIIRPISWEMTDGKTMVVVNLESLQSLFVVFRDAVASTVERKEFRNGLCTQKFDSALLGSWNVQFKSAVGDPSFDLVMDSLYDWSLSDDMRLRYFSGSAIYLKKFSLSRDYMDGTNSIILDLGKVGGLATVRVNDDEVRTLWKHPYRLDITDYVKSGENTLEVEVTNALTNALIGDEQHPLDVKLRGSYLAEYPEWFYLGEERPTDRKTFTTYHYYNKKSKLIPSGLMGIVRLLIQEGSKDK